MITAPRLPRGSRVSAAFALGALLAALNSMRAQTPAPASPATNKPEEPTKLTAFEVTGSRIKRIDTETPQPLVRITELEFKATGFSTLGDAIRAMPNVSGSSLVSID